MSDFHSQFRDRFNITSSPEKGEGFQMITIDYGWGGG